MKQAISCYLDAVEIKPDHAAAYSNLGTAYEESHEFDKAIACYRKALELNLGQADAFARLLHLLQHVCAWRETEDLKAGLTDMTRAAHAAGRRPAETPFISITTYADLERNLGVCRAWSLFSKQRAHAGADSVPLYPRPAGKKKITIGYLSNTFRNHAGAHLILGLFRKHDRRCFKVNCYSYGSDDGSMYRRRIEQDCDRFIDIAALDDLSAVKKIHGDEVDILVDLRGHTARNRIGICALRPAPVQVEFLGFPCTTGADFIDYMIVDKIVAPREHASFYTEHLVYMPHCYQVSDDSQTISEKRWSRADLGLPEAAVVFASFNTSYKFEPVVFDCWMKILKKVPGSVLWLLRGRGEMQKNLVQAATDRGGDCARIVFAEKMGKSEHLARLGAADLVLDTFICNGHTSTTDALWAGVPVLAMLGTHFASRVSASILNAVGLPELVTRTSEEYEEMAVRFGTHPELLSEIREKLAKNRSGTPLFDTARFVNNLERAYKKMWAIYLSGGRPVSFNVGEDPNER